MKFNFLLFCAVLNIFDMYTNNISITWLAVTLLFANGISAFFCLYAAHRLTRE